MDLEKLAEAKAEIALGELAREIADAAFEDEMNKIAEYLLSDDEYIEKTAEEEEFEKFAEYYDELGREAAYSYIQKLAEDDEEKEPTEKEKLLEAIKAKADEKKEEEKKEQVKEALYSLILEKEAGIGKTLGTAASYLKSKSGLRSDARKLVGDLIEKTKGLRNAGSRALAGQKGMSAARNVVPATSEYAKRGISRIEALKAARKAFAQSQAIRNTGLKDVAKGLVLPGAGVAAAGGTGYAGKKLYDKLKK